MSRRRYFPQHEAERHTVAELLDRQLETVKVDRPHDYERQRVILIWWKQKLGAYSLADRQPARPDRPAARQTAERGRQERWHGQPLPVGSERRLYQCRAGVALVAG
jgi:hypothetical protein